MNTKLAYICTKAEDLHENIHKKTQAKSTSRPVLSLLPPLHQLRPTTLGFGELCRANPIDTVTATKASYRKKGLDSLFIVLF